MSDLVGYLYCPPFIKLHFKQIKEMRKFSNHRNLKENTDEYL